MANTAQARKRVRQAEARRRHNASRRSMLRTYIKRVVRALEAGQVIEAGIAYQRLVPILDRMAIKGIVHKNKAARHKSRLLSRIGRLSTSQT